MFENIFYIMELNKIYTEDCRNTMARMPDNFIDLAITSPPYNMNLRIRNGKYCSRQIVKELSTKYIDFDDNLPIDEFYNLHREIISELLRVSKIIFYNISIVTGSKRAFFKLIGEFSDQIKDIIIWDKVNAEPAMQKNVINRQSEIIIVFEKDNAISRMFEKCNFTRGGLCDVWKIKKGKKYSKENGATFPKELIEKIILNFSNEGDLIYDPFGGTGTTIEVADENNRRFLMSEISVRMCEIAQGRILNKK